MGIIIKSIPRSAVRVPLPFVQQQTDHSCGAAILSSILSYFGKGPLHEYKVGSELKMTETGTEPYQIIRLLQKYKMSHKECRQSSIVELKRYLDKSIPVMIMLQAWKKGIRNLDQYKDVWDNGHWVAAIGYDKENFYFEDPVLPAVRGYIPIRELEDRWHDLELTGPKAKNDIKSPKYGIAIWGNTVSNKGDILKTRLIR